MSATASGAADPRLLARFTHAIARPGGRALLIDQDNEGRGWVPRAQAIASGQAFAVDVAEDIIAIDCDHPDQRPAVERFALDCRQKGLGPVMEASGRPGHLHLFVRAHPPPLHGRLRSHARGSGMDVRSPIRPPTSPHRLGLPVRLIAPDDPYAALAALERPQRSQRLSALMENLLRHGDVAGSYLSRSEAVQAITLAAVNIGWTAARLFWTLMDPQNLGGEKVRDIATKHGTAAARHYIDGGWQKAADFGRAHPPVYDREAAELEIARIEAEVDRARFVGKAGSTDVAVLHAYIGLARSCGLLVYGASVRQVAERAGVSVVTALKSQDRLMTAGWLHRAVPSVAGRDTGPTTWRLRVPTDRNFNTQRPQGGVS